MQGFWIAAYLLHDIVCAKLLHHRSDRFCQASDYLEARAYATHLLT